MEMQLLVLMFLIFSPSEGGNQTKKEAICSSAVVLWGKYWYKTLTDQSCRDVCNGAGGSGSSVPYSTYTNSYVGPSGSNQNCKTVASALNFLVGTIAGQDVTDGTCLNSGFTGNGCFQYTYDNSYPRRRCTTGSVDPDKVYGDPHACACESPCQSTGTVSGSSSCDQTGECRCKEGYQAPQCFPITCSVSALQLRSEHWTNCSTTSNYKESCSVTCDYGFFTQYPVTRTCLSMEQFTLSNPYCSSCSILQRGPSTVLNQCGACRKGYTSPYPLGQSECTKDKADTTLIWAVCVTIAAASLLLLTGLWCFFGRTKRKDPASETKPLLNQPAES